MHEAQAPAKPMQRAAEQREVLELFRPFHQESQPPPAPRTGATSMHFRGPDAWGAHPGRSPRPAFDRGSDSDHRTKGCPRERRASRRYFFAATFLTEAATADVCVNTTSSPTETLARFSGWMGVTMNSMPS